MSKFLIFAAEEAVKLTDSSTQTDEFDYLVNAVPLQRPFCEGEFRNKDKKSSVLHQITFV